MPFKLLAVLIMMSLSVSAVFATEKKRASMKRSEMSQYEGEYLVEGKNVRKVSGAGTSSKKKAHASNQHSSKRLSSKRPPQKTYSARKQTRSRSIASQKTHSHQSYKNNRITEREIAKNKNHPLSNWKNEKRSVARSGKHSPNSRQRLPSSMKPAKRSSPEKHKNDSPNAKSRRAMRHPPSSKHAKKPRSEKKPRQHASQDSDRLPYVRQTKHERDLPFISIPNTRVRRDDKTIVMGDPDTMPEPVTKVESVPRTNVNLERAPAAAEVGTQTTPPAVAPEAVQTAEAPAAAAGPREPDAFDLHSGADPTLAR